jgi:hypothetical protein
MSKQFCLKDMVPCHLAFAATKYREGTRQGAIAGVIALLSGRLGAFSVRHG